MIGFGRGAQEGYALVEVIVSLALMALIAVLLVETVRSTGRITAAIAAAEGTGQVEAVRDHLRRTFGSLASRHMDGSLPVFQGGPDVLSAVIAPDQSLERPIEIITSLVSASRTDGSADLVERRLPLETLTGSTTIAQSEVLLARVTSLSLRYYGGPD